MPFQLSPGVNVTEIDLTTVIPAVATTDAAIGGVFKWGPVDKPTLVISESELANVYGRPDSDNAETWFTAASFLAYSNRLHVSRAHHSTGDAARFAAYAVNGANYLIYDGAANTLTSTSVGDEISEVIAGVTAGSLITDIDDGLISVTVTDTSGSDFDDATGLFTVSNPMNLVEGEEVSLDTSANPPEDSGGVSLSNTATYYITSVTVGVSTTTFGLTASQGGAIISAYSDKGTGALTINREAGSQTRISLSKNFTGASGGYNFESFDPKYSFNAVANNNTLQTDALLAQHIVKNEDHYDGGSQSFDASVQFVAKYPGKLGNSLRVSVCESATAYQSNVSTVDIYLDIDVGSNTATLAGAANTNVGTFVESLNVGDLLKFGSQENGIQYLEISSLPTTAGVTSNTGYTIGFLENLSISEAVDINGTGSVQRNWGYWGLVEAAPGTSNYVAAHGNTAATDEIHIVVIDQDGDISGVPGTILEVWDGLSRATDAKSDDGGSIYYKDVINQSSNWLWWANDSTTGPSATAQLVASSTANPVTMDFRFGRDIAAEGSQSILGDCMRAYDKFKSAEDYDISLILTGKSFGGSSSYLGRNVTGFQFANYLIDNIAERRKDCVVFVSPEKDDVVANVTDITQDCIDFRSQLRSTSYAVLDSGYKYMYDKYNDVYRWIPINGDTAGLCAYTDDSRDPWWSPAGFNRGNLKNVVKLAWNPKKAERDLLYKNGINPIVNFPGQGIVMFGDKTLLAKPSAFDRINVRRLFIVLEKAIATAAKFTLFEFNDEFTRASFVNLVTPFLRDVQGRRGVTDFIVICDETNNTGEVIDRNEFVGDIYIKPARSINFIQLNFVAVRTGVEFSEVIGQF